MFKIDLTPSYFYPVKVKFVEDGGKFVERSFDAKFKRLSQDETREIGKRLGNPDNPITDAEVIEKVLEGWKGVQTSEGDEFPYSETNRDAILNIQGVAASIVLAWMESVAGGKQKN